MITLARYHSRPDIFVRFANQCYDAKVRWLKLGGRGSCRAEALAPEAAQQELRPPIMVSN
jgi:hypothetical protein